MRWFEKPEVLSYIVDAYQGTDEHGKRQFVWEDPASGGVLIGNARGHVYACAVDEATWREVKIGWRFECAWRLGPAPGR